VRVTDIGQPAERFLFKLVFGHTPSLFNLSVAAVFFR
jgi:hypothetical protein